MEQKQEREERRSQLEHGALGERPERLYKRGSQNEHTETHLYTRTEQKQFGQNYSEHTGKCKTETFRRKRHSSFVTECNEAAEHIDCGTVESQENPSGAREWRNVLKLGHSLREGGKSAHT